MRRRAPRGGGGGRGAGAPGGRAVLAQLAEALRATPLQRGMKGEARRRGGRCDGERRQEERGAGAPARHGDGHGEEARREDEEADVEDVPALEPVRAVGGVEG